MNCSILSLLCLISRSVSPTTCSACVVTTSASPIISSSSLPSNWKGNLATDHQRSSSSDTADFAK